MDIAVDAFFSALFYVVSGACIGALVGWSLTYLWFNPEPQPKDDTWPPLRKHERDAAQALKELEKKGMKL